jgi:hypothetical protein
MSPILIKLVVPKFPSYQSFSLFYDSDCQLKCRGPKRVPYGLVPEVPSIIAIPLSLELFDNLGWVQLSKSTKTRLGCTVLCICFLLTFQTDFSKKNRKVFFSLSKWRFVFKCGLASLESLRPC